jgi:hypothetical protein
MPPMQPWHQPPPPPPKKSDATWIILLVVGLVFVFLIVPFVVGVVWAVLRVRSASTAMATATATYFPPPPLAPLPTSTATVTTSPYPTGFSETYSTENKLITIHYPPDFAAKSLDDSTVIISRNFLGSTPVEDEVVTFGALDTPITNDPHELARVLIDDLTKHVRTKGGTYKKKSERRTTCLLKYPGVEVEATLTLPTLPPYTSKSCFFTKAGHGYEFRYDAPTWRLATEGPLLESIENSTDFR